MQPDTLTDEDRAAIQALLRNQVRLDAIVQSIEVLRVKLTEVGHGDALALLQTAAIIVNYAVALSKGEQLADTALAMLTGLVGMYEPMVATMPPDKVAGA